MPNSRRKQKELSIRGNSRSPEKGGNTLISKDSKAGLLVNIIFIFSFGEIETFERFFAIEFSL